MYEGLQFSSKANLLRWLGKDSRDVRLVDRMIKRGEVRKEGGSYILPIRDDLKIIMDMLLSLCEEDEKNKMLNVMYKALYNKGK